MEEVKKLLEEKTKETEVIANNSTVGSFLLKTHEETFNNLDLVAHEMATIPIKRYLMLSAESDGIDLLIKIGGDKLYKDEEFKLFIKKMNEYFNKIREHSKLEEVEEYKYNEELVYAKFKELLEKVNC
jgi:hypothetical protein